MLTIISSARCIGLGVSAHKRAKEAKKMNWHYAGRNDGSGLAYRGLDQRSFFMG